MSPRSSTLLYPLDDYDVDGFVRLAAEYGQDRYGFVVTPNADHMIRFHDDERFRAAYADAAYVLLDSRFLAYVFRLTKRIHARVCPGSDLTAELFGRVIGPLDRIVMIGGTDTQAAQLSAMFGLERLVHYNPPMGFINDPEAVEACLRFIESHSPFRFCFIGVGAPQQEILAQHLRARGIARGMALCIGASINFLTGEERRAPKWVQRLGAEWCFRLLMNPPRLARRYLVRGPRIFALLARTQIRFNPSAAAKPATPPAPAPALLSTAASAHAPESA
jgi:exopolysaccharide biosynthesis WecB/TagA/CpsF family protein